MRNLTKVLALGIVAIGCTATSFAQSTATGSTSALLIIPISIAKTTDLNFGTVAASSTAGTVVLDYLNARTTTGGATLPAGSTLQTTAVFQVSGEAASSFSIAIPASISLTGSTSGTMTVDGITCDAGSSIILTAGAKTLKVKGTLNVPINAVAGTYSNASDLFVTVNYN